MGGVGPRGNQGENNMQRRKFLIGAGSAAVGASALVGSGAFTSVKAERTMSVARVGDQSAYLGLTGGDADGVDEYVNGSDGGQLSIDLTGNGEGSGVNMGAVTEIGDSDEHESEYAFKITNQGTQPVSLFFSYKFDDASWVNEGQYGAVDQSFIAIKGFGDNLPASGGAQWGRTAQFPPQRNGHNTNNAIEGNNTTPEQQIYAGNRYYELGAGDSWYFIIKVDTTGDDAEMSDNLSGTLQIKADDADDNQA